MFQTMLLSILAFMGFAPSTPAPAHPGRVGPGPTGRRHAILPAGATSSPATGPGPGGRRHAIHRTPSPRVAHPVVQPVVQRPPSLRELQERAYALGLRTTETVRSIPAGLAVRFLQAQAGCAPSQEGLARVTRLEAETSLGGDLIAYVELCLATRSAIPSISPSRELEDDAVYRVRLRRAMTDDVELWEATAIARDRQRAEAMEAGVAPPDVLRLPAEVEIIIARKAAAAAALLKRRAEGAGGATGKGGSNVIRLPTPETPKGEDAPAVPAGPK